VWSLATLVLTGSHLSSQAINCSKVKVMLWPVVSWPVFLAVNPPSGTEAKFFYCQLQICWCEHPVWQEDRFIGYDCCWSPLAQSFLGLSPAGLMTIFYCVSFKTSPQPGFPGPCIYIPQEWVDRIRPKEVCSLWNWSYLQPTVSQSVLVSGSHLKPMTSFLFSVRHLQVSWCEAPSLTKGWVYNLLV
jgi:hypothetical protein